MDDELRTLLREANDANRRIEKRLAALQRLMCGIFAAVVYVVVFLWIRNDWGMPERLWPHILTVIISLLSAYAGAWCVYALWGYKERKSD